MYVDVLKEFKSSHPDFVGSKFVYAPIRAVNDEIFETYLPIMVKLLKNFPDFIAGFDLVGQEDLGNAVDRCGGVCSFARFSPLRRLQTRPKNNFNYILTTLAIKLAGRPLIEYAEKLLQFPENINFFFHAGETNWMGTTSDENLVWHVINFPFKWTLSIDFLSQQDRLMQCC